MMVRFVAFVVVLLSLVFDVTAEEPNTPSHWICDKWSDCSSRGNAVDADCPPGYTIKKPMWERGFPDANCDTRFWLSEWTCCKPPPKTAKPTNFPTPKPTPSPTVTCPVGQEPDASGSKCQACNEGWVAPSGTQKCTQCGAGSEPNGAKSACEACGEGMVNKDKGAFCLPCMAGTRKVSNECKACGLGEWSSAESDVCTKCPAGAFQARASSDFSPSDGPTVTIYGAYQAFKDLGGGHNNSHTKRLPRVDGVYRRVKATELSDSFQAIGKNGISVDGSGFLMRDWRYVLRNDQNIRLGYRGHENTFTFFTQHERLDGGIGLIKIDVQSYKTLGIFVFTAKGWRTLSNVVRADESNLLKLGQPPPAPTTPTAPLSPTPGYFASDCVECPTGYAQPNAGSTACIKCPGGTYTDEKGTAKCIECPEGYAHNVEGATSATECKKCMAGTYANMKSGATKCEQCPVNFYQPEAGKTECLSCNQRGSKPSSVLGATQCECFPGREGLDCSKCASAAQCSEFALPYDCDRGGACQCLDGLGGDKCDEFKDDNTHLADLGKRCEPYLSGAHPNLVCPCGQLWDNATSACVEPRASVEPSWTCTIGNVFESKCFVHANNDTLSGNWTGADALCGFFGLNVVSVRSAEAAAFAAVRLEGHASGRMWLGLAWDDILMPGTTPAQWFLRDDPKWDDGNPFGEYVGFPADKSGIQRYVDAEQSEQTCIYMDLATKVWGAAPCDSEYAMMCLADALPIGCEEGFAFDMESMRCVAGLEAPPTCDRAKGYVPLHPEPLPEIVCIRPLSPETSRDAAASKCEAERGELLNLGGPLEAGVLREKVEPGKYWLGFRVYPGQGRDDLLWDVGEHVRRSVLEALGNTTVPTIDEGSPPMCAVLLVGADQTMEIEYQPCVMNGVNPRPLCIRPPQACQDGFELSDGHCVKTDSTALVRYTEQTACAAHGLRNASGSEADRRGAQLLLASTAQCLETAGATSSSSLWPRKVHAIAQLTDKLLRDNLLSLEAVARHDAAYSASSKLPSEVATEAELFTMVSTYLYVATLVEFGPAPARGAATAQLLRRVVPATPQIKPFMDAERKPFQSCLLVPCPCGMWRGANGECSAWKESEAPWARQIEQYAAYARCALLNDRLLVSGTFSAPDHFLSRSITCMARLPMETDLQGRLVLAAVKQVRGIIGAVEADTGTGIQLQASLRRVGSLAAKLEQEIAKPALIATDSVPPYATEILSRDIEERVALLDKMADESMHLQLHQQTQSAIKDQLVGVQNSLSQLYVDGLLELSDLVQDGFEDVAGRIDRTQDGLARVARVVADGFWKVGERDVRGSFKDIAKTGQEIAMVRQSAHDKLGRLKDAVTKFVDAHGAMLAALNNFVPELGFILTAQYEYFSAERNYSKAALRYDKAHKAFELAKKELNKIYSITMAVVMAGVMLGGAGIAAATLTGTLMFAGVGVGLIGAGASVIPAVQIARGSRRALSEAFDELPEGFAVQVDGLLEAFDELPEVPAVQVRGLSRARAEAGQRGRRLGEGLTKAEVILAMQEERATLSRTLERLGQFRGTSTTIALDVVATAVGIGREDLRIFFTGGVATYEGAFFLKDITTRAAKLYDLLIRPSPVSFEGRKGGPISMQRALNLVLEELQTSSAGETVHKVFVDGAEVRNPREVQAALAKKEGGAYKVELMTVGGDVERGRHRIAHARGLIMDSNGLKRVFNTFRVDVTRVLKLALLDDGLWKGGAGQSDLNLRSGFGEFCDRNAQRRLQDVGSSSSQEESFYSEKELFLLQWQADRAVFDEGIQRAPYRERFADLMQLLTTSADLLVGRGRATTYVHECPTSVVHMACKNATLNPVHVSCCASDSETRCDLFGSIDFGEEESLCELVPASAFADEVFLFDASIESHSMKSCRNNVRETEMLMYQMPGMVLTCCVDPASSAEAKRELCHFEKWEAVLVERQKMAKANGPSSSRRRLGDGICFKSSPKRLSKRPNELDAEYQARLAKQQQGDMDKMMKFQGRMMMANMGLMVIGMAAQGSISQLQMHNVYKTAPSFPPRETLADSDILNPIQADRLQVAMQRLGDAAARVGNGLLSLVLKLMLIIIDTDLDSIVADTNSEANQLPEVWDQIYEEMVHVLEYDFELCPLERVSGLSDQRGVGPFNCVYSDRRRLEEVLDDRRSLRVSSSQEVSLRRTLGPKTDMKQAERDMQDASCDAQEAQHLMRYWYGNYSYHMAELREQCGALRLALRKATTWAKGVHRTLFEVVDDLRRVRMLENQQRLDAEDADSTVRDMYELESHASAVELAMQSMKPFQRRGISISRAHAFTEMVTTGEAIKAEEDAFYALFNAQELLRDYCGAAQYALPGKRAELLDMCKVRLGVTKNAQDSFQSLAAQLNRVRKVVGNDLKALLFKAVKTTYEENLDVTSVINMAEFRESGYSRFEFVLGGPAASREPALRETSALVPNNPYFCRQGFKPGDVEMRSFGIVFYDADDKLIGFEASPTSARRDMNVAMNMSGPFVKANRGRSVAFDIRNRLSELEGGVERSMYDAFVFTYHLPDSSGACNSGEPDWLNRRLCHGIVKSVLDEKLAPLPTPYARWSVSLDEASSALLSAKGVARVEIVAELVAEVDSSMECPQPLPKYNPFSVGGGPGNGDDDGEGGEGELQSNLGVILGISAGVVLAALVAVLVVVRKRRARKAAESSSLSPQGVGGTVDSSNPLFVANLKAEATPEVAEEITETKPPRSRSSKLREGLSHFAKSEVEAELAKQGQSGHVSK